MSKKLCLFGVLLCITLFIFILTIMTKNADAPKTLPSGAFSRLAQTCTPLLLKKFFSDNGIMLTDTQLSKHYNEFIAEAAAQQALLKQYYPATSKQMGLDQAKIPLCVIATEKDGTPVLHIGESVMMKDKQGKKTPPIGYVSSVHPNAETRTFFLKNAYWAKGQITRPQQDPTRTID